MRTAVSIGLFTVLLFSSAAGAEQWRQYNYPQSGFSAEFTGTVREIDLKPDEKTRGYIRKTSIYQQAGHSTSFSITARQYRFGTPDLQKIAGIVVERLHCRANVKIARIESGGLALSGDHCLSDGSSFVARLLARGSRFYQALAVVPPDREKDAGRFVAALHLTPMERPKSPHTHVKNARSKPAARVPFRRIAARAAPVRSGANQPAWQFSSSQAWPPPATFDAGRQRR
jgi:hypothetical protein